MSFSGCHQAEENYFKAHTILGALPLDGASRKQFAGIEKVFVHFAPVTRNGHLSFLLSATGAAVTFTLTLREVRRSS